MDVRGSGLPERRRDRRLPMAARVRLAPRDGSALVAGELVDVSAGGLRTSAIRPACLIVGTKVDVEIRLTRDDTRLRTTGVDLRGAGIVVRVELSDPERGADAALAFTGPLELREPFSQLLVF